MIAHSDAGACGGFNEAICEIDPPEWYEKYRYTYAVGPQEDTPGYLTKERDFLWGAGLVLRKTAWQHITNNGFRNRLTGRTRKKILSGEDEELCLCLQMAGWRLYYEPRLRLKHYLSANRLNLKSLRCMHRSFGKSSVILRIYRFFLQPEMKMHQKSWIWLCLESAKAFLYSYFVLMVKCLTFKGKYVETPP